jgi:hypothetical protein
MGSPSDIHILRNILTENGLPADQIIDELEGENEEDDVEITTSVDTPKEVPEEVKEESSVFDDTIRRALKLSDEEPIPTVKGRYQLPAAFGGSFNIKVSSSDMDVWDKLFEVTPPKVGKTTGQTRGSGNGEVALYWLYKFTPTSLNVRDGRGGNNPDLFIDNVGVEVKNFKSNVGKIQIGRYGSKHHAMALLRIVLGMSSLLSSLNFKDGRITGKNVSPQTWTGLELMNAFKNIEKLEEIDLDQLANSWGEVFGPIQSNLKALHKELGEYDDSGEAAEKLVKMIVLEVFENKPQEGGYIVNVQSGGDCMFYNITFDKIHENTRILKSISSNQGLLSVNFNELFV